jgi:hypothetical protein
MNILRKYNSNKGTSTVEAVIILPVLVLLTFGGLKYGLLFLRAQQITNVARQACRLAIRPHVTNDDITSTENPLGEIPRLMSAIGLGDSGYTISMPDVTSVPVGDPLTIKLTLPTDRVDNLTLVNWLPLPDNIVAVVTMSKEGPSVKL